MTVLVWIKVVNSSELRTLDSVLLMRGERICVKCFESWYVEDCTKETIRRNGTSGL